MQLGRTQLETYNMKILSLPCFGTLQYTRVPVQVTFLSKMRKLDDGALQARQVLEVEGDAKILI